MPFLGSYNVVVVVFVVALTLTHRYNAVRGHGTGANVAVECKMTSGRKQIKTR